jgi:predicted ribosome quality control (RQC) complex YloA/Tae2 family protein
MAAPGPAPRGLSAAELAAAVAELLALCGSTVLDVVPFAEPDGSDDLLLVLQPGADGGPKVFLHLAPGGPRARVATTARRWHKHAFARGQTHDLLHRELAGATLQHVAQPTGERRCAFHFATAHGDRRLIVELFGARGLWALLDAEGRVLQMSRPVATAVRTLRPGDPYAPPPPAPGGPGGEPRAEPPPRFAAPVLPAIDAHFTPLDLFGDVAREHEALHRAAARALQKAKQKAQGLGEQLADAGRAEALRELAGCLLAYAHTVRRGSASMTFPDPATGEPRTVELDPARPVTVQAQALFEKARRLDDGRAIAEQRLAEAKATVAALEPVAGHLAAFAADAPDAAERLAALRQDLQRLGVVAGPRPSRPPQPRQRAEERGENFRRFVSAEGYPILVGRNNEQNDRLTLRVAKGNDVWLHVGGGRPGSHVVIQLPKQKTASLESLLDAGTLAVHFSKARGEHRIDVIYTLKKHVRKPKGLPAGAVVPSQTKTITVHLDEERLRRLLGSAAGDVD